MKTSRAPMQVLVTLPLPQAHTANSLKQKEEEKELHHCGYGQKNKQQKVTVLVNNAMELLTPPNRQASLADNARKYHAR